MTFFFYRNNTIKMLTQNALGYNHFMIDKELLEKLMRQVLKEAREGIDQGDSPYAAFLIDNKGNVIEKAHNSQNTLDDRTAHAEFVLLRKAFKKLGKKYQLEGYSIIQNSEPCSMCMSLLVKAKIDTVYFGARMDNGNDPYIPAEEIARRSKHPIQVVGGILEDECKLMIASIRKQDF